MERVSKESVWLRLGTPGENRQERREKPTMLNQRSGKAGADSAQAIKKKRPHNPAFERTQSAREKSGRIKKNTTEETKSGESTEKNRGRPRANTVWIANHQGKIEKKPRNRLKGANNAGTPQSREQSQVGRYRKKKNLWRARPQEDKGGKPHLRG